MIWRCKCVTNWRKLCGKSTGPHSQKYKAPHLRRNIDVVRLHLESHRDRMSFRIDRQVPRESILCHDKSGAGQPSLSWKTSRRTPSSAAIASVRGLRCIRRWGATTVTGWRRAALPLRTVTPLIPGQLEGEDSCLEKDLRLRLSPKPTPKRCSAQREH